MELKKNSKKWPVLNWTTGWEPWFSPGFSPGWEPMTGKFLVLWEISGSLTRRELRPNVRIQEFEEIRQRFVETKVIFVGNDKWSKPGLTNETR